MQPVTIDDYAKYTELKEEMKSFNEKVKEVIGIFDGSLVLQSEADEPEVALLKVACHKMKTLMTMWMGKILTP